MKYILSLTALILQLSFSLSEGIYDVPLKCIDSSNITLNQYRGKKLLFLLLPLSAQDSTLSVNEIAVLHTKYQNSLIIIGIPSEEAGYNLQDADKLKDLYKDADIIITEGMKVKKGSGQSPLFQWLTNKNMNHHFDQDVQGVGSKFFVDEEGELYAVMGANLTLANPLINRILVRSPGQK